MKLLTGAELILHKAEEWDQVALALAFDYLSFCLTVSSDRLASPALSLSLSRL